MNRLVPNLSPEQKRLLVASARYLLKANPKRPGKAVQFRHQGRTLKGLDCIGLLTWAFSQTGFDLNDRTDYGKLPAHRKLYESLKEHFGDPVSGDLQVGDIVTMDWGSEECHVALVTDHPDYGLGLIHSYASAGHVIEHGLTEHERKLITSVFRP